MVITRSGNKVEFNPDRIVAAINSAFCAATGTVAPYCFVTEVLSKFDSTQDYAVEEIQDIVENLLLVQFPKVGKEFALYREKHREDRAIKEYVDYMNQYANSSDNAATSSATDANANVHTKNVANLDGEVYKPTNRRTQRYRMVKTLKKLFPEVAMQYLQDINDHIIYPHDEASAPTIKNYCEAVSMYPIHVDGTSSMDGLGTTPPKNLNSYCGQFGNLTFLLSAQCKGAVAFGEFFNFLDYYCVKDFGPNYHNELDELASLRPKRTIREQIHQAYQQIFYTINQPSGNRSYQSPFTNISYYDSNYWKAMFSGFYFKDGTQPSWERVSFLQKDFMKWFNKERTKTLLTFPVETMALLTDGKDVIDKEYKEFTAEMYAEGHSFFTYLSNNPNGLASCCRLRNEIHDNVFSFTNGLTGVQTGSVNVITINFSRVIQNWFRTLPSHLNHLTEDGRCSLSGAAMLRVLKLGKFKEYLVSILDRVYKYHIAYKTLVYEMEEAGMFTASNAGYISMERLYSTIGLNGVNEAAEFIGLTCSYNEYYKQFCRLITGTISEQNRIHSTERFMFNQEFVPAEGLSSKNYNWDKEDGYWVPANRVLYNSYFYLADDENTTVLDKFKLHGREFTEFLDGGVGLHCNLADHLSKEQYLKLFDIAIENGTTYFTFNVPNSECTNKECHKIVKKPMSVCPVCGAPMRRWTRVIGFLRPEEDFDVHRHTEAVGDKSKNIKGRFYAKSIE